MGADEFSVYLIPETLRVTVLGGLAVGDLVNVEIDSQTQVPPRRRASVWGTML